MCYMRQKQIHNVILPGLEKGKHSIEGKWKPLSKNSCIIFIGER